MALDRVFTQMDERLNQARREELSASQLCVSLRELLATDEAAAALAGLPPKFAPVLDGILNRLESGSLFSEESCSFSQSDLLRSLDIWITKARVQQSL